MALDWLDAARYADTHGFNNDSLRSMWRWRDWVIEAFNANKPYDAFISRAISFPTRASTRIASAFNRNHVMNSEVGIIDEEYRVEYVADRTSTAGTVFMGLTLQCARCHDHKYDPLTQKEFYQLFAYFNSLDEKGYFHASTDSEPLMKAPTKPQEQELAAVATELAPLAQARQISVGAGGTDTRSMGTATALGHNKAGADNASRGRPPAARRNGHRIRRSHRRRGPATRES